MLDNADTIVREPIHAQNPGTFKILFKHEVIRLSKILDGLRQQLYPRGSSLRWQPRLSRTIVGWEYSEMVDDCTENTPKGVRLGKDCGDWHRYARDSRVIPFFCSKVGDVETITPKDLESVCPVFRTLPEGRSHLAIRIPALLHKYERQGCRGGQLTPSGYTLSGPDNAFKPCHCVTGIDRAPATSGDIRPYPPTGQEGSGVHCKCVRTYQIEKGGKTKGCFRLSRLEKMDSGAIIVGTYDSPTSPLVATSTARHPPDDLVGAPAALINEDIENTISPQVPQLFGSTGSEQRISSPTSDQLDVDEDGHLSDWSSSSVGGGFPLNFGQSESSEEDEDDEKSSTEMNALDPTIRLVGPTRFLTADDVEGRNERPRCQRDIGCGLMFAAPAGQGG